MKPLTRVLERVVRRLDHPWRAPAVQVLFAAHVPGLLIVTGMLAGFGVYLMHARPLSLVNLCLALGIVIALVLTQGAVGGDRRASRWAVLFQTPVTPLTFYFRTLALRLLVASALVALATAVFAIALPFTEAAPRFVFGIAAGVWVATLVMVVIGFSLACVVRVREQSALLLMLVVGITQTALIHALGLETVPMLRTVVRYLLIPVDPLMNLSSVLVSGGAWISLADVGQTVLTLGFWLGVAAWRLRGFASGDLPSA